MRTHELKTWPSFFAAVQDGSKTFEVRENDRDFAVGDLVILHEYDPAKAQFHGSQTGYSGRTLCIRITYVMPGGRFGIDPRYCVLGFRPERPTPTRAPREET